MELPKENTVQDQDHVYQKLKESVHRTVESYVRLCYKHEEAKVLAALSPTKLDIMANNIFKRFTFPDHSMEPEGQDFLDQLTMACVIQEAIPPSFYNKANRAKKPTSLLKSTLQRSTFKSSGSEEMKQPPSSHPEHTESDNAVSTQPSLHT